MIQRANLDRTCGFITMGVVAVSSLTRATPFQGNATRQNKYISIYPLDIEFEHQMWGIAHVMNIDGPRFVATNDGSVAFGTMSEVVGNASRKPIIRYPAFNSEFLVLEAQVAGRVNPAMSVPNLDDLEFGRTIIGRFGRATMPTTGCESAHPSVTLLSFVAHLWFYSTGLRCDGDLYRR